MNALPALSLVLCDSTGAPFGLLRFAPNSTDATKGDCIFDIALGDGPQSERPEVRWLYKRRYQRFSEHRFKLGEAGGITATQGRFTLHLDPDEDGGFTARPPSPRVTARWQEDRKA